MLGRNPPSSPVIGSGVVIFSPRKFSHPIITQGRQKNLLAFSANCFPTGTDMLGRSRVRLIWSRSAELRVVCSLPSLGRLTSSRVVSYARLKPRQILMSVLLNNLPLCPQTDQTALQPRVSVSTSRNRMDRGHALSRLGVCIVQLSPSMAAELAALDSTGRGLGAVSLGESIHIVGVGVVAEITWRSSLLLLYYTLLRYSPSAVLFFFFFFPFFHRTLALPVLLASIAGSADNMPCASRSTRRDQH